MSRVEENQEMLEKVPKGFNGAYERVNNAVLIAQLYVLKDTSKSLASIADSMSALEEYIAYANPAVAAKIRENN